MNKSEFCVLAFVQLAAHQPKPLSAVVEFLANDVEKLAAEALKRKWITPDPPASGTLEVVTAPDGTHYTRKRP